MTGEQDEKVDASEASTAEDVSPDSGQREPLFNLPKSIVVITLICIAIHFVRTIVLSGSMDRFLLINFAFFPVRYLPDYLALDIGTLLSPVTYSLLHGDWMHLGINMIWLAVFGSPLAFRLSVARTLLLWVVTAVAAVLLHLVLYWGDTVPLVGASGAVSGFMGAAARFGYRSDRRNPRRGFSQPLMKPFAALRARGVLPFLTVWMVVNFLSGQGFMSSAGDPQIAWEAHVGGLLAGFFLIGLIDKRPEAAS